MYITAVLEYLCAELCELTASCANPAEYPSKLKFDTSRGEVFEIDSEDEDELEDWEVQGIYLAEAHHVLKAILNDKEMCKAFPDHGANLQRVHWSAFRDPEDGVFRGEDAEHDDEEEEDEDEDDDDEPVSSKKAGKAKAKAGTSKGITKPKKGAKGKAA